MKILVGMSGGTDSSAAALLLKRAGHTPVGATMILSGNENISGARAVCDALGIKFHTADMRREFRDLVMNPFASGYRRGETPNPCVFCNREIKFGLFLRLAADLGCEKIATGHYVRVEFRDGLYRLLRGTDGTKDQSYFLWTLGQKQLSASCFPVGDMTKQQAREAVNGEALPVERRESQDICFVPDGDFASFLDSFSGPELEGEILDVSGHVLGRHSGVSRFTVGQRRGAGVSSSEPLYVLGKDASRRTVTLGPDSHLWKTRVFLREISFTSGEELQKPVELEAKIRYTRASFPCRLVPDGAGGGVLEFSSPVRAPAPGQSAVFYRGDEVLGGGFIVSGGP